MKSKIITATAVILGLAAILYAQSTQKQTSVPSTSHRFQIVAAETDEQAGQDHPELVVTGHSVFLLDTETGKVWKYQWPRTIQDSKGKWFPINSTFLPVQVESQ